MLGNLQCKIGQEAGLAFAELERGFRLSKGHLASRDNAIRADDFFASRFLRVLEFGERKGSTN